MAVVMVPVLPPGFELVRGCVVNVALCERLVAVERAKRGGGR